MEVVACFVRCSSLIGSSAVGNAVCEGEGTFCWGEGLSTGRKNPGESALERDSGVPTELRDPGKGLSLCGISSPPQLGLLAGGDR